jgi:hypothetical protein
LAEYKPRVAEHPSGLGEDLSGHEFESAEDPFGSPEVPRRRRAWKCHYVAPHSVPTNLECQMIIKPIDDR